MRVREPVVCFITVLLSGCAAMPLSTIWRMRDFTVQKFFANDPTALRVAIRTDERVRRGDGVPMIEVKVHAASTKPLCYAFALVPVDARATGEAPLDGEPGRRWYSFRLSADGIDAFARARSSLRNANLDDADFSLEVTMTHVLDPAPGADRFPLRIDIAFDRADGYFTLIKETDLLQTSAVKKNNGPVGEPVRLPCTGPA